MTSVVLQKSLLNVFSILNPLHLKKILRENYIKGVSCPHTYNKNMRIWPMVNCYKGRVYWPYEILHFAPLYTTSLYLQTWKNKYFKISMCEQRKRKKKKKKHATKLTNVTRVVVLLRMYILPFSYTLLRATTRRNR